MRPKGMRQRLTIYALSGVLFAASAQSGAGGSEQIRADFDGLSHEMSICAAYFSLLSSIIESADGPVAKGETARHIKSADQTMQVQSIDVANHIGIADEVVMERMQVALEEMVQSINSYPANSLAAMYRKYAQPCDELLANAPRRFADLIERDGKDL